MPAPDLDLLRTAAADEGSSLQGYLLSAISAHAAHLRRQEALARISDRMGPAVVVPEEERQAVLDAVAASHHARAARLGGAG